MAINLAPVVQTYFDDTLFQDESRKLIAQREASIPTFKKIVTQFTEGGTDLKTFRQELDNALHAEHDWGATGVSFLMEINKFAKYHAANNNTAEPGLRDLLYGLNTSNLGQRIEQFYTFLTKERDRLHATGISGSKIVSPGNSAMIISLFAFWLDRGYEPIIYYLSLRRGLKMLLEAGAISQATGLRVVSDRVDVRTAGDHLAVQRAFVSLAGEIPKVAVKTNPYWSERFLLWITENPTVLEEQQEPESEPTPSGKRVIPHAPLAPTPEPRLTQLIAEIRRYILVDESVIRRIYHALLAGHVILTGPPGTGKTELARLIPELLWQNEEDTTDPLKQTVPTAYATKLVTATDEWSVRTLIGGLAPSSDGRQVFYRAKHGYLTETLIKNWAVNPDNATTWQNPGRISVQAKSVLNDGKEQEFRGTWLVIDEFNRAPIDLALGDALTALSSNGHGMLHVPTDDGSGELPFPKDFRIIGTLNSFDRNYLNQISEALKRRFSFIEVLPPSRAQRKEEQNIVLEKALNSISHLMENFSDSLDSIEGSQTFDVAWLTFEVVRVYRQLGTAQAISLIRQVFISGFMQGFPKLNVWLEGLDAALCDTIADQLQVLLPDELDVLLLYIKRSDADIFIKKYNDLLGKLSPRRRIAQLEVLSAVVNDDGTPLLTEDEVEQLAEQKMPEIASDKLRVLFRLDQPPIALPQFARRLKTFKAERGL